MAYGFIGPGHSTPGELKDAVQPSLGTTIGQALGGAAMNFAGAFKQRRDQAQREASALRVARQQHANALGLQENAARLRGKTGGLTAHQGWQQKRLEGLDRISKSRGESADTARWTKAELDASRLKYRKENDLAVAKAKELAERKRRGVTMRGQDITSQKETYKQAQLLVTNQQTSNALATENFERQSKRIVNYYAEIARTALNEAGVPADDLRFTVNGITQLLLAGRDDKGNINVKEIGPRLRERLVEAMDVVTDWTEHKDKKARSKVIFKMDASLKNKKAFAVFADELKAVSDYTAYTRKKELASDTVKTTRDSARQGEWVRGALKRVNTWVSATELQNDKGIMAFTSGAGLQLEDGTLRKLYNAGNINTLEAAAVAAAPYSGNMAELEIDNPAKYTSLKNQWYAAILTANGGKKLRTIAIWGLAGLGYRQSSE